MSKASPHDVKDSLLSGCAFEQTTKGKIPTPDTNAQYVEGILERLDKKKPNAPTNPDSKPQDRAERRNREAQKRANAAGFSIEGKWETFAPEDKPLALGGSPLTVTKDDPLKKLLRHRIRLLNSKKDWQAKLRAVNPLALQGYLGQAKKDHAVFLVREILRKSNDIFGDWWKPKPRKLWSTGSGKR